MNIFDMNKNSLPEQVQINKENIKRLMDNASINSFALRAALAVSFSETNTYNVGDLVWHNDGTVEIPENYLYKANQAVSAGIWDESQWDAVKLKDLLDEKQDKADLFDKIYPVGSIYLSTNAVDPSTLFGGTWAQIKDKFLLAAGNNYAIGTTGGEATHTLTVAELPSHDHKGLYVSGTQLTWRSGERTGGSSSDMAPGGGTSIDTASTGSGDAHNNMPPYLVVNVWERTA